MTDWNAAANASMSQAKAAASVKPAHCQNCDAYYVAWAKSARTGKWYLADAIAGVPGKVIPMPRRPHFKTCTKDKES